MQTLNEILNKMPAPSTTPPQTPVGGVDQPLNDHELLSNVNKVFTTLRITYPAWYEKYYKDQKSEKLAKRIWATGINELTTEQINKGLQRMVLESEYPPKLKDFIQLCNRIDNLPDLEVAWSEALMGCYSHIIIKVAAQLTGVFELRQASYDNPLLKKRFNYYLDQVIKNFNQGKTLNKVNQDMVNKTNQLIENIEQKSNEQIKQRIKQQGINHHNARIECLALLGIKRP